VPAPCGVVVSRLASRDPWPVEGACTSSRTPGCASSTPSSSTAIRCASRPTLASSDHAAASSSWTRPPTCASRPGCRADDSSSRMSTTGSPGTPRPQLGRRARRYRSCSSPTCSTAAVTRSSLVGKWCWRRRGTRRPLGDHRHGRLTSPARRCSSPPPPPATSGGPAAILLWLARVRPPGRVARSLARSSARSPALGHSGSSPSVGTTASKCPSRPAADAGPAARDTPSAGAVILCSSSSLQPEHRLPARTASPTATPRRSTVPGMGATSEPEASADSGHATAAPE